MSWQIKGLFLTSETKIASSETVGFRINCITEVIEIVVRKLTIEPFPFFVQTTLKRFARYELPKGKTQAMFYTGAIDVARLEMS